MRLELTRDARAFQRRAADLLSTRLECNLLATVLDAVLAGNHADIRPLFAWGAGDDGRPVFAALRTPPRPLICCSLPEPSAADGFVAAWLGEDPELPGVTAPKASAAAIAAAWAQRTGATTSVEVEMAMYELVEVAGPWRVAPGELRPARAAERDLAIDWWRAFARDAGLQRDVAGAERAVDARLAAGGLFLWEDERPVSLVAVNPQVAGVVRVGPVYTPPAHRRRGYAGCAVAAVSRLALRGGARRCALFTDVANPTSNKIYAEVGYVRVAAWESHVFADR